MPPERNVIEAVELSKTFGGITAVDGLSFQVRAGELFGLLGPNGAGKTSTIRMTYGFSPLTGGSLRVFGLDITRRWREIRSRTGVCHQENNLDPDLSVFENLLVFSHYFGMTRRQARARADELLEFIGLKHRRDAVISTLSGGMMRRLTLARSLVNRPELLILDEPTTGLDPQARHQVWERIETLKAQQTTVLLTTHYMEEASRLCDRLIILDAGKILVEGAPSELVSRYAGRRVIEATETGPELREYLERHNLDFDDLGRRLIIYCGDDEKPFSEINQRFCRRNCILRMGTLEDVFLRLTGRELRE